MTTKILIGGCGSSGTTLLRKMLNSHPEIACGPEMSVFDRPLMYSESIDYLYTLWRSQDFDPLDAHCIFPLRKHNRTAEDLTYCGLLHENHMQFYHSADEVDNMFHDVSDIPEFLDLFFSQWAEKQQKPIWAEKTPNNVYCASEWLDAYTDGVYINVVRDGRDAVLSMNLRRKIPVMIGSYRWATSIKAWMKLLKSAHFENESGAITNDFENRIYSIKYEDLILKTEKTLDRLCRFIGVEFDYTMLEYWKVENPDDQTGGVQYAKEPVFKDSIGRWQKPDYDPTILDQILALIETELDIMGYEI